MRDEKSQKFLLDVTWAVKYTNWLKNNELYMCPIDNTPFFEGGKLRTNILPSKYLSISEKIWMILHTLYGGGPEIPENQLEKVDDKIKELEYRKYKEGVGKSQKKIEIEAQKEKKQPVLKKNEQSQT